MPCASARRRPKGSSDVAFVDDSGRLFLRKGGAGAWRNNNPGHLRHFAFTKSQGSIGEAGRFAVFPDFFTGRTALKALLRTETYAKLSIDDAVKRYTPPTEDSTESYASKLKQITGLDIATKLADLKDAQLDAVVGAGRAGPYLRTRHDASDANNMRPWPMRRELHVCALRRQVAAWVAALLWVMSASVACAASAPACQEPGDRVTLSGRVQLSRQAGPPHFEGLAQGDASEVQAVLHARRSLSVRVSVSGGGVVRQRAHRLQLIDLRDAQAHQAMLARCRRACTLTGRLIQAESGHHHTPFLLELD